MINDILNEADGKMDKSVEATREEFAAIRAGRVSPSMFNKIVVDYYGSPTPLQQLASFTAPEARIILIAPFDQGAMHNILKAIRDSDIGGYAAGVLFGRHPMAPVISPKKSWEGFAGSVVFCLAAGWALVVYLLDGDWWVGLLLGLIAVVMATLGDLCESVIKRDLGIKDMSQVIPGHGGLMDRLDSLLATIAPIWLLLHSLVY